MPSEPWEGQPLSAREREVLLCAARGLSAAETADALGMTRETARAHRRRLMVKLGASNITQAVVTMMNEDQSFAEAIEV